MVTFWTVMLAGFILLKEISCPVRVGVWIQYLIKPRITLVAIEEFDKLLYRDV